MKEKYKCWWCKKDGDSKEHKFKRTDLVAEFGETFEDKEDYPVLLKKGKEYRIRGPKAKAVKFESVLCAKCNNQNSQNFDNAYSEIMAHLVENHREYEKQDFINLQDLYPINWKEKKINFYSYFVKHFCCRLSRNNIEIPEKIIKFLNREVDYLEIISLNFHHKLDTKLVLKLMEKEGYKNGFVEFSSLTGTKNQNDKIEIITSYLSRKWVKCEIYFWEQITRENFQDLESFFSTPIIPYTRVNTLYGVNSESIPELHDYVEKRKREKDYNNIEDQINKYFSTNPYS